MLYLLSLTCHSNKHLTIQIFFVKYINRLLMFIQSAVFRENLGRLMFFVKYHNCLERAVQVSGTSLYFHLIYFFSFLCVLIVLDTEWRSEICSIIYD